MTLTFHEKQYNKSCHLMSLVSKFWCCVQIQKYFPRFVDVHCVDHICSLIFEKMLRLHPCSKMKIAGAWLAMMFGNYYNVIVVSHNSYLNDLDAPFLFNSSFALVWLHLIKCIGHTTWEGLLVLLCHWIVEWPYTAIVSLGFGPQRHLHESVTLHSFLDLK